MNGIKFNTNVAIFLLFFGASLIEALQAGNWLKAVFWFAIGLVFLIGDNVRTRSQT